MCQKLAIPESACLCLTQIDMLILVVSALWSRGQGWLWSVSTVRVGGRRRGKETWRDGGVCGCGLGLMTPL